VREARTRYSTGEIDDDERRAIEDTAIDEMIPKLEATGIESITDGEFHRIFFHTDFLEQLDGVTVSGTIASSSDSQETVGMTPPRLSVTGKLRHLRDIQIDDFEYLASRTSMTPKVAIPSPTMVHFRGGRDAIDVEAYPNLDEFFEDLARCYREEIAALHAAGCRYLQLDDTNLAYLCDPEMRQGAIDRGDDPDELPHTYAGLINAALADRPEELSVAVHLCRGNYRSTWFASGGYEPVAEALFNELDVDAFFLEYDDERSGDFAPLRFVPDDKTVVLGLITTKRPELESGDDLMSRIEEASRYVPIDRLGLSPQCGFSSTIHGNEITEEDQWAKLRLVVDVASDVWS
jgi:5-methyltetrahydropteroyltriglutamate--homocysteine methyltransferase